MPLNGAIQTNKERKPYKTNQRPLRSENFKGIKFNDTVFSLKSNHLYTISIMRKLVSAKELAKELKVNLFTIYRADEKGEIVNYGLGRAKRYDLNEILKINQ